MVLTMKKIFAVLVTLLFVASVFGVAQTLAGCFSGPSCIKVGTEFEVMVPHDAAYSFYDKEDDYVKFIEIEVHEGGTDIIRYEAKKVGTRKNLVQCSGWYDAVIAETCTTTTQNSYPMSSFMKILGFGKKK